MFTRRSVGANCALSGYDCSEVDYVITSHKLIGCVTFLPSVAKQQVISLRWKVYERFTETGSKRVSSCICFNLEIRENHLSKVANEKEIQIYGKPYSFLFKIQVETEKDGIPTEQNTFTEFDVRAYNSPSRTFLYVRAIRVCFMKISHSVFS